VINSVSTFETIVDTTNSIETILEEPAALSVNSQLSDTVVMPPVEQPKPNLASTPSQAKTQQAEPSTVQATALSSAQEQDRRTIVMTDEANPARAARGKIVGWLITYNRNPDGDDYRVYAGYNRLGANPVCDILIDDETVSGSHAIIVYRDGRCLIKDDLSRNGTFVNGREITEAHPLQNYDQIRIGNTYLTFVAAQQIS
jgi:predicted component of type VI protein secretion system